MHIYVYIRCIFYFVIYCVYVYVQGLSCLALYQGNTQSQPFCCQSVSVDGFLFAGTPIGGDINILVIDIYAFFVPFLLSSSEPRDSKMIPHDKQWLRRVFQVDRFSLNG